MGGSSTRLIHEVKQYRYHLVSWKGEKRIIFNAEQGDKQWGVTTCWGRLGTGFFEGIRLRRIVFVRRGVRLCKERNSLGCSEGLAIEGGCGVVKAYLGQVLVARCIQGKGFSATVNIATMQSRKQKSVR